MANLGTSAHPAQGRAAVFSDVEGTLVDASIPRLALRLGRELGIISRRRVALAGALALAGRLARGNTRRTIQALAVIYASGGMSVADAERLAGALLPLVTERFKPGMLALLREKQAEGLPVVLVSGGMHPAIVRIGEALGARGEGTKLRIRNGRYLARVDGAICQGPGKATRARVVLAETGYDPAQCYAYGDTESDIPFLELFGHPSVVDPDPALAAEARRHGWPILRGADGRESGAAPLAQGAAG